MKVSQAQKLPLIGASIGTMMEYYDYALFMIFLPIVSPLFFPQCSAYKSLEKGYIVLLISTVFRPLGGFFFGYIGDSLGRKKALLGSMYGIALSTFILGLIPPYTTIGVWGAIIITLIRAAQMFCFGGEYNGAGIYVVEHSQGKNEGVWGSLLTAAMLAGALIASISGLILTLPVMPAWSWRIAFWVGGIIGVLGIVYRKRLAESPNFQPADKMTHTMKYLCRTYPRQLIATFFVGGFATLPFTTVLAFINPVLMTKGYLSSLDLMLIQALIILIAIITLVLAGRFADQFNPRCIMLVGSIGLLLFSFPLLVVIDKASLLWVIAAEIILIIFNELLLGPSNAYLKNLFPMQYRYRAISVSFCLGIGLIGGVTPLIESYLFNGFNQSFASISLWLIVVSLFTGVSIICAKGKDESGICALQLLSEKTS